MKINVFQLGIATLCLTLAACVPSEKWECPSLQRDNHPVEKKSDFITSIIQIDGTPSMQGYVNIPNSRYIRTLNLIDDAVLTAFLKSEVKYYRFGVDRQPLTDQNSSRLAQNPEFYPRSNDNLSPDLPHFKESQIDKVIEPIDPTIGNDLYIIVTDLYQSLIQKDAQNNRGLKTIKERYLLQGYSVGILGVKSEFDGMIYDVGYDGQSYDYITDLDNYQTFHPFYIIVLGKYENIVSFFNQMKRSSKSQGLNFPDDQYVIFYPHLVEKTSFLNINLDNKQLPSGIKRLTPGHSYERIVMLRITNPQTTERLKIDDSFDGSEPIKYEVPYSRLPYTLPLKLPPKLDIKGRKFDRQTKTFVDSPTLEDIIQFPNLQIQENKISFNTVFKSKEMSKGVYQFQVDALPSGFEQQVWWTKWNFSENNFDGAKTYNLLPFLQNLSDTTLNIVKSQKNAIGRFCYVVQKNSNR